jgi:iron-sulfur cluster repair protein YtfE (RIC family)
MAKPRYQPKLDLTDWKKTDTREFEKILTIAAPELHSFIEEHAALSQLMDQVREGYHPELYHKALSTIGHELEHHFLYEEKFILSRLANHITETEVGPITKLKSQHNVFGNTIRKPSPCFNIMIPKSLHRNSYKRWGCWLIC